MNNPNHIALYKDVFNQQISSIEKGMAGCFKKGLLKRFGTLLEFKSLRVYFPIMSNKRILSKHIFGEEKIWREIDVKKVKKEIALKDKIYIFKIQYSTESGHLNTIGYLGIYRGDFLTEYEIGVVQVFCLLYGTMLRNEYQQQ